jgi:hypothetical protein
MSQDVIINKEFQRIADYISLDAPLLNICATADTPDNAVCNVGTRPGCATTVGSTTGVTNIVGGTIHFDNTFPQLTSSGGTVSLVQDGTFPTYAVKGFTGSTHIQVVDNGTSITLNYVP